MSGDPPPPPEVVPVADVDAAREAMMTAESRLDVTIARASSFSEEERNRRVDGEWSTIESLRHLVLVVDLWLSRVIQGDPNPFHPMALPPTFMPPTLFPGTSIDPQSRPSFEEACGVLLERFAALRHYVDELTPDELARPVEAHAKTVGGALSIIFNELAAHDGFINRDLDTIRPLASGHGGSPPNTVG